jgi:hypothetical protein
METRRTGSSQPVGVGSDIAVVPVSAVSIDPIRQYYPQRPSSDGVSSSQRSFPRDTTAR